MAKKTDNNQTGMIVFLRSPIPNSLNEPSILYKKAGFNTLSSAKRHK
jgi:hypothetical protein